MLQRVDENVEDSLLNVQEGYSQLSTALSNMRSNRGLMVGGPRPLPQSHPHPHPHPHPSPLTPTPTEVRVFAVLFFFIVLWGTFFA